jgi:outer membrane protein TolC
LITPAGTEKVGNYEYTVNLNSAPSKIADLGSHYHDATVDEKAAVDAAQRTLDFAMALYKQGATDYLTVVTSQTALLQTQIEALNLDTMQLSASVNLILALGGGWKNS